MAVCTMNFWGEALQKQCSMNIILPESPKLKKPYCLLLLLHGMSDDHTIWLRRTSIDRYVVDLPLVVVMPNGDRSGYCDAEDGPAYEQHIMKDALGFAEKYLPVRKNRNSRAISGLSMGGYGSMKLGLKYPSVFVSIAAHSSGYGYVDPKRRRTRGGAPRGRRDDVFAIAEKLDPEKAPAIRFDCGKQDFCFPGSRAFHKHLAKLGFTHTYREYPGAHRWDYWDEHIQQSLKFHMKHLET